jgi:ParB-like chromosome segregation protein Spo0J
MDNQAVDINTLVPRKDNPRKGDLEAIKQSLKENGQYRPIVVNERNNEILAGNHTWMAAKELGWNGIAVWFVNVDETKAKKIVLADNRLNDLGGYDDQLLLSILKDLEDDLEGTGYDLDDMEDILATIDEEIETPYEEFSGDYAESAEETEKRYEHRENKPKRVKEIVVAFPEEEFDDFVQDIFELKSRWQLSTTSEIVAKAIRDAVQK